MKECMKGLTDSELTILLSQDKVNITKAINDFKNVQA